MEVLKNRYTENSNNIIISNNNPTSFNNLNNFQNQKNNTGEEQNFYSSNEDLNNYDTNANNNDYKNPNIEINQQSLKGNTKNNEISDIFDKIYLFIKDIKEIDEIVPFCEEKNRKELLLDRGLLLCLKVNELMNDFGININDILYYKKSENLEIDTKLLDENYWMNQKVDKYARTEQRKRIPQERWFMLKDNSFTTNLNKCFALNRGKFINTYNWLNSLENK